jgi:hypothetical protein
MILVYSDVLLLLVVLRLIKSVLPMTTRRWVGIAWTLLLSRMTILVENGFLAALGMPYPVQQSKAIANVSILIFTKSLAYGSTRSTGTFMWDVILVSLPFTFPTIMTFPVLRVRLRKRSRPFDFLGIVGMHIGQESPMYRNTWKDLSMPVTTVSNVFP